MTLQPFAASAPPVLASTGPSGYTFINGTGTIISWTAPNDGQYHYFILISVVNVTSGPQAGGQVRIQYGIPHGGGIASSTPYPGSASAGIQLNQAPGATDGIIGPGQTVSVVQFSAQTAGTAVGDFILLGA